MERTFEVKTSELFFKVLSSKIYKEKHLAVLRELITNAYDAMSNKDKKIIEIQLPFFGKSFILRDYGTGLTEDEIYNLYATYGSSSKRENKNQIGAFGLGSKAPFAVADEFFITSYKDGKKYKFVAYLDNNNSNKIPKIRKISEEDTDESNGLKIEIKKFNEKINLANYLNDFLRVVIPIKLDDKSFKYKILNRDDFKDLESKVDKLDYEDIEKKCRIIFNFYESLIKEREYFKKNNFVACRILNYAWNYHGIFIGKFAYKYSGFIFVLNYKGVWYKLPEKFIDFIYNQYITHFPNRIKYLTENESLAIIINIDENLDIAVSRENIEETERNFNIIKKTLNKFFLKRKFLKPENLGLKKVSENKINIFKLQEKDELKKLSELIDTAKSNVLNIDKNFTDSITVFSNKYFDVEDYLTIKSIEDYSLIHVNHLFENHNLKNNHGISFEIKTSFFKSFEDLGLFNFYEKKKAVFRKTDCYVSDSSEFNVVLVNKDKYPDKKDLKIIKYNLMKHENEYRGFFYASEKIIPVLKKLFPKLVDYHKIASHDVDFDKIKNERKIKKNDTEEIFKNFNLEVIAYYDRDDKNFTKLNLIAPMKTEEHMFIPKTDDPALKFFASKTDSANFKAFKDKLQKLFTKIAHMCNKNIVVNFIPQKIKQDKTTLKIVEEIYENNLNNLVNFLKKNATEDYKKMLHILLYKEKINDWYENNEKILFNYLYFYDYLNNLRTRKNYEKFFERNNISLEILKDLYQDFNNWYIFETTEFYKNTQLIKLFTRYLTETFNFEIGKVKNFNCLNEEAFQKFKEVVQHFTFMKYSDVFEDGVARALLMRACKKYIPKK